MNAPLKIPSCLDKLSAKAVLGLFSSTFLFAGLAMGYFVCLRPVLRSHRAQTWIETPCQISTSEVQHHRGSKGGTTYSVDITYTYKVAGLSYWSNLYDFTCGSSDSYNWRAAAVRANPPGKTTVCYVDPQDATNAVLSRSCEHNVMVWIISGAFSLFGLAMWTPLALGVIRRSKFGKSVFELKDAPVPLGGVLQGSVILERIIRPENGFAVKLVCIHRVVTGSGKSQRIEEIPLWVNNQQVQSGMDNSVPVSFALPEDGFETSSVSVNDRKFWRVEVKAKVPGIGYAAQFEVPVSRAALSMEETAEASKLRAEETQAEEHFQLPAHSRIRVQDTAGGKEFYFLALRNPSIAIFLTVFLTIWTGVIWAMIYTHVPVIFPIGFGFFEILLLLKWVDECFATTRVVAQSGQITVTKHFLGLRWLRTIPASDIREIKLDIGTSMGSRSFYNVQIVRRNGSSLTAGDEMADSHEAHWLALELARRAGVGS